LQLGGKDVLTNTGGLNQSVNTSFGAQVNNQIRNLPDGTYVRKVTFIPAKPGK